MALTSNVFTVTLAGEDLGTFDENKFTLEDAFVLEGTAGVTVLEMLQGIRDWKAAPLRGLVWFMKFKRGDQDHISGVNFNLTDLKLESVKNPTQAETPSPSTASGVSAADGTGI